LPLFDRIDQIDQIDGIARLNGYGTLDFQGEAFWSNASEKKDAA
jgi:hypothetical protein